MWTQFVCEPSVIDKRADRPNHDSDENIGRKASTTLIQSKSHTGSR